MDLRELLARSIMGHDMRLQNWESAKPWLKNKFYRKADEALKRAGIENCEIKTKVVLTENVR